MSKTTAVAITIAICFCLFKFSVSVAASIISQREGYPMSDGDKAKGMAYLIIAAILQGMIIYGL